MNQFTIEINNLTQKVQHLNQDKITEVVNALHYINTSLDNSSENDYKNDDDFLEDGSLILRLLALGWYLNQYIE